MFPKRAELLRSSGDGDALMNVRQVCQFFGNTSKMTIYRWTKNPASEFPPPFKVGQKNFWLRRDIIAFRDMRRARAHPAVQAASDSRPGSEA
jgi:predicted DNA-binding transcriptional regulator AlpA